MTELRQVWVEPDEIRGGRGGLFPGQTTTLRVQATWFALRKWDGTEPIPPDTVVKVVETRPYGSYLVTEVPDGPAVKRAIKALSDRRSRRCRIRGRSVTACTDRALSRGRREAAVDILDLGARPVRERVKDGDGPRIAVRDTLRLVEVNRAAETAKADRCDAMRPATGWRARSR